MNFLLTRPQDIAAAATSLVSSSSANTGSAKLEEIALINQEDKTTINNLSSVFSNGLSPVTASEFSVDGGAAIIPAGTSTVNLSSYGLSLNFNLVCLLQILPPPQVSLSH